MLPPATGAFAWQLAMILAIITMTLGNICALWQKNVRRLFAYSSVAHAGYMLIGVTVALAGGAGGISGALFYVVVYSAASIGTFAALTYLESEDKPLNGIDDLAGLVQTRPIAAAVIAVCMFSFSGIPIFAGFWGKFGLFMGTIQLATSSTNPTLVTWFVILSIVGMLNAAIAAAYYLRIVALMFFYPSRGALPAAGGRAALVASVLAGLAVLGLGISWNPLMEKAKVAEQHLAQPAKVAVQVDEPNTVAAR
jgi:NADH-quinone oxidoreductase subunit N